MSHKKPATFIKPRSRQRERLSASVLSICLFVCLSVCLSVCQRIRGFRGDALYKLMIDIDIVAKMHFLQN